MTVASLGSETHAETRPPNWLGYSVAGHEYTMCVNWNQWLDLTPIPK